MTKHFHWYKKNDILTLTVTQHFSLPLIIVKAVTGTSAPAHVCLCCVAGVVLFIKHCLIKRARARYKMATGTFFWKNGITIYTKKQSKNSHFTGESKLVLALMHKR